MTVDALKDCNKRHLAQLAKEQGIVGWHAMRKDQLIRALSLRVAAGKAISRPRRRRPRPSQIAANGGGASAERPHRASRRPPCATARADLDHACQKDRIVVMTRDPYWLHTYWELSRTTLARAQAALGQDWHTARPILRLMDVSSEDTTSSAERRSAISRSMGA